MDIALTLVTLLAIVVAVSAIAGKYSMSAPLVLIVVGIIGSYTPFVPDFELTPEIVLVGLLPPLLYAASIRTSLIDFRANKRPIILLSVGLVLFTTAGIGVLVWWILDVPFAVALALGAVVAPPDAVAATAIARRVGLPRRVVTILEGESLVNDATAIVTLRASIAAIAGTVG
ncbi:MAG: cation:proton antiporter, partial [Aeromicrobium sp.]